MQVINAIGLQNYGPFKEVKFKIQPGLTTIYGLNRAGGKASRNTNGVGKSALVSSIPEIVYEEPIVGEKQDRIRSGVRSMSFTNHRGKRVLIQRVATGRTDKVKVKIDGQDQQYRTSSIAKQAAKKLWPITQEEYNTYVHIDSRVPHPLVMGNSSARKSFFTSFFGLDKFDAERKLYAAELAKLKRVRAAYDELRAQYDRQKDQLISEEELARYQKLDRIYKRKLSTLQEQFAAVQNTISLIQFANSAKEQIKALSVACHDNISAEEFEEAEKLNAWELKDAQSKLEDAQAWETYQRDTKTYIDAFENLNDKTKRLLSKYGFQKLKARAGKAVEQRMQASVTVRNARSMVQELKDKLSKELPAKVLAPEEDEGDLETLRRAYKHQLDHASKFKKGKCETCGQIVRIKDPQVLKTKLESVVKKLNQHAKARLYKEALTQRRADKEEYTKWMATFTEAKEEEARLSSWESIYEELINLPEEPSKFEGRKLQVKVCQRMVEEIRERKSLLEYMKPHLETVIEFLQLSKADIKAAQSSSGLTQEMNSVQEKWSKIQAKLELHKSLEEQVGAMRARLKEMRAELEDEEPLKILVNGYQDKNIKKMAIEAISQRLMVLVNRYAQRVFPEQFSFEFRWDTQIQLLVHRHYGKKVRSSDVRKLSGAESTLFTLILVCALLAFVPSNKRCNVLILDEPAARLSKEMQLVFQDMLQILNQLIPSIIVITPHDEVYEGSKPFTIVKRNGVSTIVEGFPHQVT
jgi:DNA repair exonuclease SbcCD ATPase subunit